MSSCHRWLEVDNPTFTFLVDIIPVTSPDSPIFEVLPWYMIPGVVLRVNRDNALTPVQRGIPSGEGSAHWGLRQKLFESLSSSGYGHTEKCTTSNQPPESSGPNTDTLFSLIPPTRTTSLVFRFRIRILECQLRPSNLCNRDVCA